MRAFDTEGSFIHPEEELLHHHPVEATPDSTTCSPAGNKAAPPMNIAAADRTPITPGDIAELVKSITSLCTRLLLPRGLFISHDLHRGHFGERFYTSC